MVTKIERNIWYCIFMIMYFFCSGASCRKDKNCPKNSHDSIEIQNKSAKTINWQNFDIDSVYVLIGAGTDYILEPSQSTQYKIRRETCVESYFQQGYNEYFLIFDNDTVQAIGWQAISGTNRGLLKRIEVDLEYLQNSNFTITYP